MPSRGVGAFVSSLLSIDPGLKSVGWAYWGGRELVCCGLSRTKETDVSKQAHAHWRNIEMYQDAERRVSEMMVWRGKNAKSSPADLLKLNIIAGRLASEWLAPSTWKGWVEKKIHQPRILAKLSAEERAVLAGCKCPPSLLHNVIDAVGIGLYCLGRMRSTK